MTPGSKERAPYRVLRKLGQGSMAEVLLADLYGARVAIKRILPPLRRNPKVLALFREEAKLLARLDHENIPAFVADDAEGPEPWLAIEYVDGADLQTLLRAQRSRLGMDVGAAIVHAMARALAYAHALKDHDGTPMRIVHRDVSPSNVLLAVDGAVKLADFGVARHDARPKMTRTGALVGKLTYMAPEQLRGAKVDARTDVFGWGVVAYELLAGVRPFERDPAGDPSSLASTTLVPLASQRRGIDAHLASIIDRALAIDADKRFDDGGALVRALGKPVDAAAAIGALVGALAVVSAADADATLLDGTLADPEPSASTQPRKRKRP